MESPPGLQDELQRLVDQATDLSGMNQLSRTLLQLLHDEKDATNQRVIKEAILLLAQKAVDAKKALEQKVTPSDAPDVACQVIFCVRDVKVHRINNGTSELLETADMHVVLVSTEFGHEMAFVEVGNFHYPLTPAIPCLRSLGGSYILALQDDVFYGLSLPDGIHEAYVQAFDRILTALADFRIESTTPAPPESAPPTPTPVAPEVHIADRVAASLEAGAERLSTGIENTSALLVAGIEASQGFLKERIRPLEEPMSVNPFVSLALRGAASGSGYVVAVKPVVIEKFVSIARFIGRQTVAWIPRRSQGEGNGGAGGASATAPLVKVGGAALLSATRVWESLSKAGDQLVVSTGKTAAALVSHRYGAEAGAAAEHAVAAVRNTMDVYNTRPTQIIKSVALAGGKASVKEYLAQKPSKEA